MSRNRKRPTFMTEEVKQDVCNDCDIMDKCVVLKEVNRMSMRKGGNYVNSEFGCNWHVEKSRDRN